MTRDPVSEQVAAQLRIAAKDVHLWAHAMSTQQAATAAAFAADRILELAGIDGTEADEVAREAHAEWLSTGRSPAAISYDLRFTLPSQMLLTANQRLHWTVKATATADLRELGRIETLGRAADCVPMARAHLTVHVGWPTKHRRDVANISPTIKALIDGIVDAGLLPDDDDTHLIGPDLRPYFAGVKGHVVLDFEFEEVA